MRGKGDGGLLRREGLAWGSVVLHREHRRKREKQLIKAIEIKGMKRKPLFLLMTVITIFLLYGCGNPGQSDTKTVEAVQFTDLIFDEKALVPNSDFSWNMSKEDFLSKIHRADIFDPDNESFDEYRFFFSEETNITTFTPMITYDVGSIPGEAEVIYAFREDGLFKSGYVWTFEDGEAEKAQETANVLINDFNTNENILENQFEAPDLLKDDTAAFPYQYQWSLPDSPEGYIKLGIFRMRESILVQVTVGIV